MVSTASSLGLAALIAVGGLLLTPVSAHACSCVAAGDAYFARNADVVLVGTVTHREVSHPSWPIMSSADPVTYDVAVDQVMKGSAGPQVQVESALLGASCGLEVSVGRSYLLYLDQARDGGLSGSLCGGSRAATPAAVADSEAMLGPASAPETPREAGSDSSGPAGPGPDTPGRWLTVSGAAVTGSALLAVVLGLVRHRRRARAEWSVL